MLPDEGCFMALIERDTCYFSPMNSWAMLTFGCCEYALGIQISVCVTLMGSSYSFSLLLNLPLHTLCVNTLVGSYIHSQAHWPGQIAGCDHQHTPYREGQALGLHGQMSDFYSPPSKRHSNRCQDHTLALLPRAL